MPRSLPYALLLALLVPTTASARRVYEVKTSGEFTTIQAAIDAASAGDRILIDEGTWSECLTVDKDLEFAGSSQFTTTIDCAGNATNALSISSASVWLDQLHLRNAGGRGFSVSNGAVTGRELDLSNLGIASANGGAFYANASTVRLNDSRFSGNTADNGGVFYAEADASVTLHEATILGSSATSAGGVGYINEGQAFLLESSISTTQAGTDGGAFYITDASPVDFGGNDYANAGVLLLAGSTLVGGTSGGNGGYVAAEGQGAVIAAIDAEFSGGTAGGHGGAIYADGVIQLVARTASFDGALAAGGGGGIAGTGAIFFLEDVSVTNSTAQSGSGGGITWAGVSPDANLTPFAQLEGVTFTGNSATGLGGGLRIRAASFSIQAATFTNNSASAGGGLSVGALAGGSSSGSVDHARFTQNTATTGNGGGIRLSAPAGLTVRDAVFDSNSAAQGGGFFATGDTSSTDADIRRSTFTGNSATDGGAIAVETRGAFLTDLVVTSNTATDGGGLHAAVSDVTVTRGRFSSNSATSSGGGAYFGTSANANIDDSRFAANSAIDGGAIASVGAAVNSSRSWYCENTASGLGAATYVEALSSPITWQEVAFGENRGGGSLYVDSFLANTRGVNHLNLTHSSVVGHIDASLGAGVINANPTVGDPVFASSFANFFASNGVAGLQTDNHTGSGSWSTTSDYFQGNTLDMDPANSFANNLDGQAALFPTYATGDGCLADLTPNSTYTNTGAGYPDRSSSADLLFTDPDGDGETFAEGDCAPSDSTIYSTSTEVPNNGRDDDCDGVDGDDGDGDGVPNSIDCNDSDSSIPGTEVYYNGSDEDCTGLSDYDQDGDIYDLDTQTDSDFPQLLGDCVDTDPTAFPGAVERWYDLDLDSDCDGRNNYDQDHDGVVKLGFDSQAGGTAPLTGDCDDLRDDVYPGATDSWYDGVDSDCGGENDFDQDGDGYIREGDDGNEGNLGTGDCDDTNPNINPGMTEDLNNEIDDNCDGYIDLDTSIDSDSDGIPDVYELDHGSDPNDVDSDDDGIEDGEEWHDDCDTYDAFDPPVDTDGDGTIDALDTDSDDDGLADADEATSDSDGDCLEDYRDDDDDDDGVPTETEVANGTDPLDEDSDDDNITDAFDPAPLSDGAGGDGTPAAVEDYGCGCQSSSPAPLGALLLPLLVAVRRRK